MPTGRRWCALLLTLMAGCAATTAPPVPRPDATTPGPGDPRIDVDVDGVGLDEVMARIAGQAGRTILVDPHLDEVVTVTLTQLPWREAVEVIARMVGCEVEERPGGVLVLNQLACRRVRIQCNLGARLRTVLQLVAAYHGAHVILPDDLPHVVVTPAPELDDDLVACVRQLLAPVGEFAVLLERGGTLLRVVGRTLTGRYVAHDDEALWLEVERGGLLALRLPPRSAAGALGAGRRELLRGLRDVLPGERVQVRCACRAGALEAVGF